MNLGVIARDTVTLKQEIANFRKQAEEKRQMAEQLRRKLNE
jgi:hypothetical protein